MSVTFLAVFEVYQTFSNTDSLVNSDAKKLVKTTATKEAFHSSTCLMSNTCVTVIKVGLCRMGQRAINHVGLHFYVKIMYFSMLGAMTCQ